jgi:hypothetical protein
MSASEARCPVGEGPARSEPAKLAEPWSSCLWATKGWEAMAVAIALGSQHPIICNSSLMTKTAHPLMTVLMVTINRR